MKTITIVTANPNLDSLCYANADALTQAAESQGYKVTRFEAFDFPLVGNITQDGFPPAFDAPRDAIMAAEHLVICCPMWNFGVPGALKNFIDGVAQAGKLFRYTPKGPEGLLNTKSTTCVWTSDGPGAFYKISGFNVVTPQIKQVFGFCGIKNFQELSLHDVRGTTDAQRKTWLDKLKKLTF